MQKAILTTAVLILDMNHRKALSHFLSISFLHVTDHVSALHGFLFTQIMAAHNLSATLSFQLNITGSAAQWNDSLCSSVAGWSIKWYVKLIKV